VLIHPKHILWPTDFSTLSLKGAEYAEAFQRAFGAQLHVLHVCPPIVLTNGAGPLMSGWAMLASQVDLVGPAKAKLSQLAAEQFGDARGETAKVVVGTPWYEICRQAHVIGVDLIVIATHGSTGLRHLVMEVLPNEWCSMRRPRY
jgi:universal stress protein A